MFRFDQCVNRTRPLAYVGNVGRKLKILKIVTSLALAITVLKSPADGQLFSISTFRPSPLFPRYSTAVSLAPLNIVSPVRTMTECSNYCALEPDTVCQSVVYQSKTKVCNLYPFPFLVASFAKSDPTAEYREKYPLPVFVMPTPAAGCSYTPVCMFMSADGSYVTITSAGYNKYRTMADLVQGSTVTAAALSNIFPGIGGSVTSCFAVDYGATVYIITGIIALSTVYEFSYNDATAQYDFITSGLSTLMLDATFGAVQPAPTMFLGTVSWAFGLLGVTTSSSGGVCGMILPTYCTFHLGLPSSHTAFSQTTDPNMILVVGSSNLYIYYVQQNSNVLVGALCP